MYYHLVALYILIILVITALVYIYVDHYKDEPQRITLFVESTNILSVNSSTDFQTLFDFDARYEKIKGKVKVFAKFLNVNKNNLITIRLANVNSKAITKEVTLSDERTGVLEFDADGTEQFIRLQTKTSSSNIDLERLEIEF